MLKFLKYHLSLFFQVTNNENSTYFVKDNLRVCHPEFDKEVISDGCKSENARYRSGEFEL